MNWLKIKDDGVLVSVSIVPKSSRNEVCGFYGESLKIKIAAAPEDGKANNELICFLADLLGISKHCISILSGHTSRQKIIKIKRVELPYVEKKLCKQ